MRQGSEFPPAQKENVTAKGKGVGGSCDSLRTFGTSAAFQLSSAKSRPRFCLRDRGGAGASADAADRGRLPTEARWRRSRLKRRPSPIVSPGANLRPVGPRARPLNAGRLGDRAAFMLRPVHERLLVVLRGLSQAVRRQDPVPGPGGGRTKIGQFRSYAVMIVPGVADPPQALCRSSASAVSGAINSS
jgi:hypothetical protein